MNIAKEFWRYWKWLCVALMTSFVVLALAAAVVHYFKSARVNDGAAACIDSGGTWDDGAGLCKSPA